MYNERRRYLALIEDHHSGKTEAIKTVMKETKFKGHIEDMAQICFTPSEEAQRFYINKMRLTCDRCNTNKYLVAEPVVLNFNNTLIDNVEYYCANPYEDSSIYSKCWNHVQGYENREGDNTLTIIQEKE